jgi:CheY-like chemotaxis protein
MRKKILLVDDMATVTKLERVLLGDGYDYLEARNGQEGVDLARKEQPDLILMDVNMPVMGGIEALRKLKSERDTRWIPVVMVTTMTEQGLIDECERLGSYAFLNKPLDRHKLVATVLEILK